MIKTIDKVRRRFLWGKGDNRAAGVPLVNWNAMCAPKQCCGLGIPYLELRNVALLLRWWWRMYSETPSLWQDVAIMIKGKGDVEQGPKLWIKSGSFFCGQLQKIKAIFLLSCTWKVGDGRTIAFWFDAWGGTPLGELGGNRPLRPNISLRDAWPLIQNLTPQGFQVPDIQFDDTRDELLWKWNNSAIYSAKSMYKVMVCGGRLAWGYEVIWKCKAPPNARLFAFLLLKDKLLTHEVMIRRGFLCDPTCQTCREGSLESLMHLFF